jgi:hypothetical protein
MALGCLLISMAENFMLKMFRYSLCPKKNVILEILGQIIKKVK